VSRLTSHAFDGEKIPEPRLAEIYVQHPDAPPQFGRSTLLVGGRGVGKTTLLRLRKHEYEGVAVHLSLVTEFASIAKATHAGPLEANVGDFEKRIAGKATSLLAVGIAWRLARRGLIVPGTELLRCLPRGPARRRRGPISSELLADMREELAAAPLQDFSEVANANPVTAFVDALADVTGSTKLPVLLMLDRADMVSPAALIPPFQLLEQAGSYITVVAMRPGVVVEGVTTTGAIAVAGDDYDVVHLGVRPRSEEWLDFLSQAVRRQVAASRMRDSDWDLVTVLARESVRTALELAVHASIRDGRLERAADDLRQSQLTAAQTTLRHFHPDFRRLVNDVRAEVIARTASVGGPVLLDIRDDEDEPTLFGGPSRLGRFASAALRWGALTTPEDQHWQPGWSVPDEFEVPPLFMYRPGAAFWDPRSFDDSHVRRSAAEVLRTAGGPAAMPTVVALEPPGELGLQHAIDGAERERSKRPRFRTVRLTDVDIATGLETIGTRVRSARMLVVNSRVNDPLGVFAVGYGWALGRRVLFVRPDDASTGNDSTLDRFPRYASPAQSLRLAEDIVAHVTDAQYGKAQRPPRPVPGLVCVINAAMVPEGSLAGLNEAIVELGYRTPEQVEVPDLPSLHGLLSNSIIRTITRATLIVLPLMGESEEMLAAFLAGAVTALPTVGYGRFKAERRILAVRSPGEGGGTLQRIEGLPLTLVHDGVALLAGQFLTEQFEEWDA